MMSDSRAEMKEELEKRWEVEETSKSLSEILGKSRNLQVNVSF
jgi:hypothetical protein